ncbi:hypothetical protein D3C75_1209630 [compost metagenome]
MMTLDQSELSQRVTDFTAETADELGDLLAPQPRSDRLNPGSNFIQARQSTIVGGSAVFQPNIIAKHVLGSHKHYALRNRSF